MAATLQAQWDACHGASVFPPSAPQDQIDAAHFMQRVSMAMSNAALTIMAEDPGIANHANRMLLVKAVLGDPQRWTGPFAQAFAAHGFDQGTTDNQLNQGAAFVWNGFAGAV